MSDVTCAICEEPWEYYGVKHGDMEPEEADKFLKGQGCPYCGFGAKCPRCNGTGKHPLDTYYPEARCPTGCMGKGVLYARQTPIRIRENGHVFEVGEWCIAHRPNMRPLPDGARLRRRTESYLCADGMVHEAEFTCPDPVHIAAEPCRDCQGTGKPAAREGADLRAAESHLDASDEEPIGLLIERGLA